VLYFHFFMHHPAYSAAYANDSISQQESSSVSSGRDRQQLLAHKTTWCRIHFSFWLRLPRRGAGSATQTTSNHILLPEKVMLTSGQKLIFARNSTPTLQNCISDTNPLKFRTFISKLVDPLSTAKVYKNDVLNIYKTDISLAWDNDK